MPALAGLDRTVVVDAGRWSRSQVTARRLVGCDVVAVVCTPTVEGIEGARWLIEPLGSSVTNRVVVVLVGDRPYPPGEVAAAVGVPVVGVLAWDPRGLNALVITGAGRGWARSALARSARSALGSFTQLTEGSVMGRD